MADLERKLDAIFERALQNTLAPSLSVAATRDGRIAYVKSFGSSPDSVYCIASVTKQFTSACVMRLVRAGVLSLDDRVDRWFPALTRAGDITIRDLLAHSSGYPDYYPLGFADEEKLHDTAPQTIVERYATRELQFEPKTAWSYSNTGYHIAGLIVERVTGRPFGEVLTEYVLRPSGMSASYFNDPPARKPQQVEGYTRFCLGPLRPADAERAGWTYASGAIASTSRDLATWHAALMRRDVFDEREIAEMTSPYTFKDGSHSALGLGWFVEKRGPHDTIHHNGGIAGFSSQTIVSLKERCSVVVLANGDHVPTGPIATQAFEAILPGAAAPALPPVANSAHAEDTANRWLAQFRDTEFDRARLEPELDGYLTAERIDDARRGLREAGEPLGLHAIAAGERGGMPWYRVRTTFAAGKADVVLRETASRNLAEFNVYPLP